MFDSKVYTIALDGPDDVEGLNKLIDSGEIDPKEIVGMIFTVEGDPLSGVIVTYGYTEFLSEKLGMSKKEVHEKIPIIACRGLTGLMVPHVAVFTRRKVAGEETGEKRLAIAGGTTRTLLPEELGTMTHVREVAKVVRKLMTELGIEDPKDVKLVWVKSHWGTQKAMYASLEKSIQDAAKRGKKLVTENYKEMGARARACGTLGAGVALGDIEESKLNDENINKNYFTVYTLRALSSAGNEHPEPTCQIVLFGNSTKSVSNAVVGKGLMKDAIDIDGVKEALRDAGLKFDCCPSPEQQKKIIYTLIGTGLHATQTIRGHRHTLTTDPMITHINWTLQKAPPHAVVAAVTGNPVLEVCSAVEHSHPPDGVPVFVIARTE